MIDKYEEKYLHCVWAGKRSGNQLIKERIILIL